MEAIILLPKITINCEYAQLSPITSHIVSWHIQGADGSEEKSCYPWSTKVGGRPPRRRGSICSSAWISHWTIIVCTCWERVLISGWPKIRGYLCPTSYRNAVDVYFALGPATCWFCQKILAACLVLNSNLRAIALFPGLHGWRRGVTLSQSIQLEPIASRPFC